MEMMAGIFIVGFIILGIYKLFALFVQKKERLLLIDKLPDLLTNNESGAKFQLPEILFAKQDYGSWPLRIALLLVGVGLGCLCGFIIQCVGGSDLTTVLYPDGHSMYKDDLLFVVYFACISIFGGAGLLAAYLIERKQN